MDFCKFIDVYGFHLHFNHFQILKEDMSELMVTIVYINNILECCGFGKDVVFTKSQRIATDTVIIVVKQKFFRLEFIADG